MDFVEKAEKTLAAYSTTRDLCSAVVSNEYNPGLPHFTRSLVWKLTLITEYFKSKPHLPSSMKVDYSVLTQTRNTYQKYSEKYPVPWSLLQQNDEFYQEQDASVDPLSNTDDLAKLQTLVTDCKRLFPSYPNLFIKDKENSRYIITSLFIWWKLSDDVNDTNSGYRQGMHEIFGLIMISLIKEQLPQGKPEQFYTKHPVAQLYDPKFTHVDSFTIFNRMMYKLAPSFFQEDNFIQESIKFDILFHNCDRYHHQYLTKTLKIDSSIWLIRYYRLLLIRELGLSSTVLTWDKIFAFSYLHKTKDSNHIEFAFLIPYIVVLLITKLKPQTLASEYDQVLYMLLHYPIKHRNEENKDDHYHFKPVVVNINQLVTDAITLSNTVDNAEAFSRLSKKVIERYSGLKLDGSKPNHSIMSSDFLKNRLELRLNKKVKQLMER
ncbi:hypothetical protein LJB42_001730 [Komagataella kurtzmanii]|nr:hypothetical protein LJB42_001730 [Komagataella kurtzmanii]